MTAAETVLCFSGESAPAEMAPSATHGNGNGSLWTLLCDYGPQPCLYAALAFKKDSVALFGGVSELGQAQGSMYGTTWTWDGNHWTLRQDFGPPPRFAHAMSYDSTRRYVGTVRRDPQLQCGHGYVGTHRRALANVPKIRFQDLRHSFASLEVGIGLKAVVGQRRKDLIKQAFLW